MYKSLIVLTLIAFVVVHVQNETRGSVSPTERQVDLINGVLKEQLWPNLWFNMISDDKEWMHIIRLFHPVIRPSDPVKMLQMIPLMMGCDYGLKLSWFLSSAVHVIGECVDLSRDKDPQTGDCWTKFKGGLARGLFTVLRVISTLAYVHSVADDDNGIDEFYQSLVPVRNALVQRQANAELSGFLDFGQLLNEVTVYLHRFLVSNCRPEYRPFDLEEWMSQHELRDPASYSYDFFLNKTDRHIGYINDHLTQLGFHYNAAQDTTVFDPNQTPRWLSKSRFIRPGT